jgi:hypothetical protein
MMIVSPCIFSHSLVRTYRVDWTAEKIDWSADGVIFNTLTKRSLGNESFRYPDTPMRISFGVWQAQNNPWAGKNMVDFEQIPPQNNVRFLYHLTNRTSSSFVLLLINPSRTMSKLSAQNAVVVKKKQIRLRVPLGFLDGLLQLSGCLVLTLMARKEEEVLKPWTFLGLTVEEESRYFSRWLSGLPSFLSRLPHKHVPQKEYLKQPLVYPVWSEVRIFFLLFLSPEDIKGIEIQQVEDKLHK